MRKWSAKDVVEVTMPFTKHLDFGPDKMEKAPAYEPDGKTNYAPEWVGALMYGPLVMAATGYNNWDEATVNVAPDLSNITLNGAADGSGADAHLYTLSFDGHTFMPDYAADRRVTHYFRMNIPADPSLVRQEDDTVELSALKDLVQEAKNRREAQQAWLKLTVKVPEYAPWAPHGFARMVSQLELAAQLLDVPGSQPSQAEVDKATSELNAIINSMRPGNLPELEDLTELQSLLEQAKAQPAGNPQLDNAIGSAEMVVKYVSDGSGTMDMIQRAVKQLKDTVSPVQ